MASALVTMPHNKLQVYPNDIDFLNAKGRSLLKRAEEKYNLILVVADLVVGKRTWLEYHWYVHFIKFITFLSLN